ncbi:MAG: hypothetical protein QF491_09335 [Alphaproteobacteria bacterium]|nr:hypothetical protein [Alphaproteobacteria bacterium]
MLTGLGHAPIEYLGRGHPEQDLTEPDKMPPTMFKAAFVRHAVEHRDADNHT